MKTKITLILTTLILLFSASTVSAQNLFTNGSFEDADPILTGGNTEWRMLEIWGDGLRFFNDTAASTVVVDTYATDGVQAAGVTWGDDSGMAGFADYRLDKILTVEGGKTYNFNFDALTDGRHINFALYIEWYTIVDGVVGLVAATDGDPENDHWHEVLEGEDYTSVNGGEGFNYLAPATTTFATVGIKARYGVGTGGNGNTGVAIDGTYTIIDNFSFTEVVVASVEDQALDQAISFYPNPATEFISVNSRISLEKVEIFSILGKRVKEITADFNSISISDLSSGNLYFVKIYSEEGGLAVRKLIKQ